MNALNSCYVTVLIYFTHAYAYKIKTREATMLLSPVCKEYEAVASIHLNFRAGSTFPFPVCTVPSSMDIGQV